VPRRRVAAESRRFLFLVITVEFAVAVRQINRDGLCRSSWRIRPRRALRRRHGYLVGIDLPANVGTDGEPDLASVHTGRPPSSGEKWILSQWIRDRAAMPPVG